MSTPLRRGRSRRGVATLAAALLALPGGSLALAAAPGDAQSAVATASRVIEDIALWSERGVAFSPSATVLAGVAETHRDVRLLEALYVESDETAQATITPAAQAALIEADLELAEALSRGDVQQRALGTLLMTEAKAVADYSIVNLRDEAGRFTPVTVEGETGDPTVLGDARMLAALTRLQGALGDSDPSWPYSDTGFQTWFATAADETAAIVVALEPEGLIETEAVLRALDLYAATAGEGDPIEIKTRIGELAEAIPTTPAGAMDTALSAVAHRAAAPWRQASDAQATRHTSDLIAIVGTDGGAVAAERLPLDDLTVLIAALGGDGGAATALETLIGHAVGSGLLTAGSFELAATSPRPTGRIPAAAVIDVDGVWSPDSEAASLDASLRMMTELLRAVASDDSESTPSGGDGPRVIDIVATDFAFSITELTLVAGEEVVIRLDNKGVVPHNIDAPDLGLFVEAPGGEVAELTYVVPAETGSVEFICNLPGHAGAGMVGTLSVATAPADPVTTTTVTTTTTPVDPTGPPQGTTDDGPHIIEVVATEFGFSPEAIQLVDGAEVVIRLDNRGLVPHNIDAPDLGLFVEAPGGATADVTFVATAAGDHTFVCSIPGHAEAGMTGALTIGLAPSTPAPGDPPGEGGGFTTAAIIFTAAVSIASIGLAVGMVRFGRIAESHR